MYLYSDSFSPRWEFRFSGIIGYSYAECVRETIGNQLIFARSLKAIEFTVERTVMRISENRANSVTWKN